jgi:hypothetical protein
MGAGPTNVVEYRVGIWSEMEGNQKGSGAIRHASPPMSRRKQGTPCALFLISANCIDGITSNFKMLLDDLMGNII